jgi:HPt (histidine-containing phosphotransfer) domain-containing protein
MQQGARGMMIDPKRLPAEVLAELRREFTAGLPARLAQLRQALDELERGASPEAATKLRLTAHSLLGTAATFGATELTPHAEHLESLGREWQQRAARDTEVREARRVLESLATAAGCVDR